MKVTTETLGNCEVLMTVEIDRRQEDELLRKAARRIAREVKIPGFRPGKAPYRLILNRFGEEAIQEEAMDELTKDIFEKATKEASIEPYAIASLDNIEWNPLVMKVKVPTEPVIDLGNYRDIRLEVKEVEVAEDEVDEHLERLAERFVTFEPVERAAQLGDMVSVTLSEKDVDSDTMLDEEREMDITLQEVEENAPEPDLMTPLIGMSEEEEKTFTHTFSESHHDKRYAGKEIEFQVRVNAVKVKEVIEFDDEFASMVGDFDTLDELKENIEKDLVHQKQHEVDGKLIEDALVKLIERAETIQWPLILEEQELDNAIKNQEAQLEQSGLDLNVMLAAEQKTLEAYREDMRDQIRENLKSSFVLSKLVELEELEVDNAELSQHAELMVAIAGNTQEAIDVYTSQAGLRVLANNLLADKARRQLLAIVKGEAAAKDKDADLSAEEVDAEEIVETEATEANAETAEDAKGAVEEAIEDKKES